MREKTMKNIMVIILLLIFSGMSFAQVKPIKGGEKALRQLDQQLKIARELLRTFPNKEAENLIRKAETLRTEVISLYARRRFNKAAAKLMAAMNLANKAINLLSRIPMERILQQVEELIRRAEQIVPGSGSKEAERLLRDARKNKNLAIRAFRANQYQKAMEQLRVAKFLVERSLSLVEGPKGNIQERLQVEKARLDELWQRAKELTASCNNPRADRLINQAKRQFQSILQAVNRGDTKLALTLYYNTSRLLLRAIDLCEGRDLSLQDQAREEIEMLSGLIMKARERIGAADTPKNKLILDKAIQLQRQAQRSFEEGKYNIALRRVSLARSLINRLWIKAPGLSVEDRARQELSRLRADIDKWNKARVRQSASAKPLLRAARQSARDAELYLTRGRVLLALESILAGNRFISLLETTLTEKKSVSRQSVEENLARLRDEIARRASMSETNPRSKELIEAAQKFAGRAERALRRNENELAAEYTQIGFDLVRKSKK